MPRRRFAVALLAPPAIAGELDAFRRAVGARRPANIAPHVTLVPPVNLSESEVEELFATVRLAAERTDAFEAVVGPVATFAPRTPTVHLEVTTPADPTILSSLRDRLRVGPLDRPDDHRPFAAHLTLDASSDQATIDASLVALAGYRTSWTVNAVHTLEHRADPGTGRLRWCPVAEAPLGPATVVGRGGVEVRLRVHNMVAADVAALTRTTVVEPSPVPGSASPLAVVASTESSSLAGAAVGSLLVGVSILEAVVVDESSRGLGIGPHLVHRWSAEVAERGADVVLVDLRAGNRWPGEFAFLDRLGFTGTAGFMLRRL